MTEPRILGEATPEEIDSLSLIQTKLACAQTALKNVPSGLAPEEQDRYVRSCIDSLSDYQWLEKDFWSALGRRINFTGDVYLNFATRQITEVVRPKTCACGGKCNAPDARSQD